MASLLFQSAGKGGSSSSSSSASANPFQALAHFYEQELSDLQTDSRLNSSSLDNNSRQYRQQHSFDKQSAANRGHHHLFPSSTSSSSSSSLCSSPSPVSASFVAGGRCTQKDRISYTQLQDEFKIFETPDSASAAPSHVFNQYHQNHHHGGANADISEHLKQRQEYYAREALLRSQDRRDGLGPIMDFSEQMWADFDLAGKYPSKSRLEDHLEARHNNPYASSGQQIQQEQYQLNQKSHRQWGEEQQQQGMRASSQQEQVLLDLDRSATLDGMDQIWNMTHVTSSLSADMTTISSASVSATGSSAYRHAAVSAHSSWPLAPWAIETEAALLEFEAAHHDDGGQYHYRGHSVASPDEQHALIKLTMTGSDWSEEYTQAAVAASQSSRRESLKTCGFMFDTKHDGQDLSDPTTILSLAEDTHMHSRGALTMQPIQAPLPQHYQPHQFPVSDTMSMPMNQPTQEPIERVGQVYNDDVFEGDMLQAWMETLVQEKQEADERAKEEEDKKAKEIEEGEEKTLDETEQKLVLEVALRRLTALMRQLGHKQGGVVAEMAPRAAQAIMSLSV
ncbi:hypothetical protein EDD21DRAFT_352001 [Dissophora ornata]|nr:hypothetical protein EDD21DRAFT_352001 [Dissophora ornata]